MVFDDTRLDDEHALASVDDALREVAGWGAEVRRAAVAAQDGVAVLERDPMPRPRAVVAAGPDGRLLRTVLEPVCPVPFVAWPHPGLPGWAGPLDLVVVLSTTGEGSAADEATVAEAVRRGCELLVSCPATSSLAQTAGARGVLVPAGSTDPLAVSVPVLSGLHALGLGPPVTAEPVAAALDEVAARCGPAVSVDANPAKQLALTLADRVPVVWGGSPLAGRAARRLVEGLRAATGVPAVAGAVDQLEPLLAAAEERDVFADPFADTADAGVAPPVLVVLDDGAHEPAQDAARDRLVGTAQARGLHVHEVCADDGPDVARFASLLAIGRFAATYLALGQGSP
jgi:hypothetical protein